MTDKSAKILQVLLYVLLGIGAVLGILFYTDVVSDDLIMYWGYTLVIVTAVITIVAPIIYLLFNLKSAVKFLVMLGALVVLALIAYVFAGNEFSSLQLEKMGITADTSKWVGAGLIFTYILAIVSILAIIYASISRIFK